MAKKIHYSPIPYARLNRYQLAGWQPTCVAESGLGCRLIADVMIPMPDGVHLSADVYLPAREGKYPVILQFSAYNRDLHTTGLPTGNNEIGSPPIITDRGYVQVVISARSIGRSEGGFQSWQNEQETDDHFHCISWAADQPWSTGEVCLFGTSYYGMNQASVARRNPPALRAFFAHEICTDFYRHVFHYGGIPNADFLSLWTGANFNSVTVSRYVSPWKRALLSYFINHPWLWKRLIKPNIDKIIKSLKNKEVIPEALRWYIHLLFDSNRREDSQIAQGPFQHLHQIDVPFVVAQNLGDISLHQYGAYDLFEHAGTELDKKWLIIGAAEYELPVYSWQLEALAFFDYVIKGIDNGYAQLAKVRYWVEGKNQFDSASNFPVPEAIICKYYLKGAADNLKTHSLHYDVPEPGENSWLSIPHGIEILPNIGLFETQKLAYELVLTKHTTLVGPIKVKLVFSCNEIDSYLITRLGRVDHQGNYHLLSMGHFRPATRTIDSSHSTSCELAINTSVITPLKHHEQVILEFSMTPATSFLKPGERLIFEIASRTDQFHIGVKEGFIIPSMAVPPYFCRNKIHYGENTYIELSFK